MNPALSSEATHHLVGIHPPLDQFESHLFFKRSISTCYEIHRTHTPPAELSKHAVGAYFRAGREPRFIALVPLVLL